MQITLHNAGKRYNYEWIFRNLDLQLRSDICYAILGPNGSGKSTLLQCISTYKLLSEGKIAFEAEGRPVNYYPGLVAIAAPYLELIEEFTMKELFQFQEAFSSFQRGVLYDDFISITGLAKHQHKVLKLFSSGMKQRVKLALAVLRDTPVLLLDEPTTNLDTDGVRWYQELMTRHLRGRIVVIGSNDEREYTFCSTQIQMRDYKK
ncbi:MAG: ATP-binding cassette domain-containing protein [Bacteroidota bacterium]|jgi:ABC-type multidrug transport system ATPase subunit